MPSAALIDWCGPFHTVKAACAAVTEQGCGEALYVAIGSRLGQSKTQLQYVGITKDAHPFGRSALAADQVWSLWQ